MFLKALWALGNVSGDSPQMRGVVLDVGVLSPLLKILKEEEALLTVSTAMWVLSHLCKGCSAKDEASTYWLTNYHSPSAESMVALLMRGL